MSEEHTHNFVATDDVVGNTGILNKPSVFRFKFAEEVVSQITNFAKIHQYDKRDDYQEAWKEWVDENDDMIFTERKRLNQLGYQGDVEDKMYKAGRYYFRNKSSSDNAEKTKRRKYIPTSQELICAMDAHIKMGGCRKEFKPSDGYDDFCENYRELLSREINITLTQVQLDADEMSKKIKKTYKNRYFILTRKQ